MEDSYAVGNQKRRQDQQGGRPNPQPKGKGKGYGKQNGSYQAQGQQRDYNEPTNISIPEQLDLQRRLLLRVSQQAREDQKYNSFILEISTDHEALRKALTNAKQLWYQRRPERAAHPQGELGPVLWFVAANKMQEYHDKQEQITNEQKDAAARYKRWLQSMFTNKEGASTVRKFAPLSRKFETATDITWLWTLRFDQSSAQGRDVHETTAKYAKDKDFLPGGLVLRADRGSPDTIEKRLMQLRISQ
jgi:hypothetical protein